MRAHQPAIAQIHYCARLFVLNIENVGMRSDETRSTHAYLSPPRDRYMKSPDEEYTHGKARGMNQAVIISGESGAGKTEASKQVMRYLITASQLAAAGGLQGSGKGDGDSGGSEGETKKTISSLSANGDSSDYQLPMNLI